MLRRLKQTVQIQLPGADMKKLLSFLASIGEMLHALLYQHMSRSGLILHSNAGYGPLEMQSFAAQFYPNAPNGEPPKLTMVPFAFPLTFGALAPAATLNAIVTVPANADFLLLAIHHHATIAAAAQTVSTKVAPCVRMLITDTGSSESFTNAPVDLENYSQNDGKENALAFPRLIGGLTSLNIQVTSFAAAETYNPLEIFLEGIRIRRLN